MNEIPDVEWCARKSKELGIPVRCPFATVEACPRYYQSLSLLGEAGSTEIPGDEDDRLRKKWEKDDLWPRTAEYATAVSGWKERPSHFSNLCPEVAFDRFGFFASYLGRYADEQDTEAAHQRLGWEGASGRDPRWQWVSIVPMHYSECPLYAVLERRSTNRKDLAETKTEPSWWQKHLIEIVIGLVVVVLGGLILSLFG